MRTKDEPYGLASNSASSQRACDDGTTMASRSNLAHAVAEKKGAYVVGPIATLGNPPESDHPQHLSAWEPPEMKDFTKRSGRRTANFNTCAYQEHLANGRRHFKPQKFVGTLLGLEQFNKTSLARADSSHLTSPSSAQRSPGVPHSIPKSIL